MAPPNHLVRNAGHGPPRFKIAGQLLNTVRFPMKAEDSHEKSRLIFLGPVVQN